MITPDIFALAYSQALPKREGETQEHFETRVGFNAVRVQRMMNENSPAGRVAAALDRCEKPFTGTITQVAQEANSKRFLVDYYTGTEQVPELGADAPPLAEGCERIRTEPAYRPEGLMMGKYAKSLIGHRVLVHKELESFERGKNTVKVKVLRWLDDLGVDSRARPVEDEDGRMVAAVVTPQE